MGAMGAIIGSTMLILVPLLSLLGLPIQTAIGTAKVSVISREMVPAIYFHKRSLVKFGIAVPNHDGLPAGRLFERDRCIAVAIRSREHNNGGFHPFSSIS